MQPINLLLCLLLFIPYNLALVYIGVFQVFKKTIIPSLLLSIAAYITKISLDASPIVYTIMATLICIIILRFFNKIDFQLCIIGSLLSFITLVLGSLLVACPILINFGFKISSETTGIQWIFLNITEFLIPSLVLIILRIGKFSVAKYIE